MRRPLGGIGSRVGRAPHTPAIRYQPPQPAVPEPLLCIEIVEHKTGKVEKKLGPYSSEQQRDKADAGVNRQLNHEQFFTRFAR